MERIGIAPQGNIIPTGNGADFRRVSRHERVCRTFYSLEDKQMNAAIAACAASGLEVDWHGINWAECYRQVRRLQARIVKAVQEGRWGKVKALQWLLTHSFSGKAIAVKRVTENQGKKTPGVDGETWPNPETKSQAVLSLKRRGYKPLPLETGIYPQKQWKIKAARHSVDERPGDAGFAPAGAGTRRGNHGG